MGSKNSSLDVEDAAELKLGHEFQNEHCLLLAEVKILMDKLKQNSDSGVDRHQLGPLFHKTLAYATQISHFDNPETVKEVRRVLADAHLEPFECAQLANLLPGRSDEAKTLIPRLPYTLIDYSIRSLTHRKDDDDLQVILNELQSLKRYQN